ncbi:MAG: alpha/beta-hydrolase family protein [Candidatus Nanopelagicales bacterium]
MNFDHVAVRLRDAALHRDVTERTAALIASASVGGSFEPGLLPRSSVDQAVATGVVTALNYSLVSTSQSFISSFTSSVLRTDSEAAPMQRRGAEAVANLALIAVGITGARALAQRPGEPIRRAVLRTGAQRTTRLGLAGLPLTAIATLSDVATRRYGSRATFLAMLPSGVAIGSGVAAYQIWRLRRRAREGGDSLPPATDPLPLPDVRREAAGTDPTQPQWPPVTRSAAIGVGVSLALHGLAAGETYVARLIGRGVNKVAPGTGRMGTTVGHAATLSALGVALATGMEYLYRGQEQGGAAIEEAYKNQPAMASVSGGPRSVIDWHTLTREGARFVNMALPVEEIEAVTHAPASKTPIRVFGGLDTAKAIDVRVDLAMQDLEQLGAFERSLIVVASPTGSGYINYAAVETYEYLTRGDCATVTLQYSLRPSFLSLDRVSMGREQNRALLHALTWRIRSIPEQTRPRVVGFGESLGAHTLQDAFLHEGTSGFRRVGMDRALFLGTPAESGWAKRWRADPDKNDPDGVVVELSSYQEWLALDEATRSRARIFLLSHHEDPITRFTPSLMVQQPDWLGPSASRPTGVARDTTWRPISTFVTTLVDVKNAMNVQPGYFVARGHDYRANIASMVAVAYGLAMPEDEHARIEEALRRRELLWARNRLVAEQLLHAKESVQRQLRTWGILEPGPTVATAADLPRTT